MNKITKLIGVDSKAGRRSRTGSTISMGISDKEAIDCQQYFMALEAGEEPTGNIKKIELVMYSDADLKHDQEINNTINDSTALIESIEVVESKVNQEELEALEHQYNQTWISKEYYDKEKRRLLGMLPEEKLNQSHQGSLDIFEKGGEK